VPQHAGLFSLLALVRNFKINTTKAKAQLSVIIKKILDDQYLLDDSKIRNSIDFNRGCPSTGSGEPNRSHTNLE